MVAVDLRQVSSFWFIASCCVSCDLQEEERRLALVMARKEEEKRREMNKVAILKVGFSLFFFFLFLFFLSFFLLSFSIFFSLAFGSCCGGGWVDGRNVLFEGRGIGIGNNGQR